MRCVLRAPTDCLAIWHLNKSKEYSFIFVINPDVLIISNMIYGRWAIRSQEHAISACQFRKFWFHTFPALLPKVLDKLSSRWVWSQSNILEEVYKSLISFCYLVNRGMLPLQVSKMVGKLLIKCRWANKCYCDFELIWMLVVCVLYWYCCLQVRGAPAIAIVGCLSLAVELVNETITDKKIMRQEVKYEILSL